MVNKQRLIEEFKTLAAFDSESYQEKDIAEYLFDKLTDLGLEVKIDDVGHRVKDNPKAAGNIYGYLKGNTEGEPVLFSAHMDTVAPGVGKKVILHEDGKVTSDGTTVLGADDISGIVAILEMLTVIKEKQLLHPDIEVALFIAEEVYGPGSANFDYSLIKAKKSYTLDLDGAIGRVANRAPSIIQFNITVSGKSAHAGFEPENGISAIKVAADAISGLELGRIDDNTTANIGTINGGTGKNIVPGRVVLEGEVRSLDNDRAHAVVDSIRDKFVRTAEKYGAGVEFRAEEMIRAYHTPENSGVIKSYSAALEKLGYGKPEIITTFGGSDNNNFCKHGIEGVVISNAMNKVHTVNEYFYMDDLIKSSNIVLCLALAEEKN